MIIFESVTKQFGDESFALKDISFNVGSGEMVIITGPSGSGKTTLMRLLIKEYIPSSGEIIFDQVPLSQVKNSQVHHHRRKIGVVYQDYKLLPELTVWENIALALYIINKSEDEIEHRVTDLLKLVHLVDKAYLFPNQLSGGEAQRVSIARALATGPSVIFADEPTGNLDPETSLSIAQLLKKINDLGTTILLATHDTGVLKVLNKERHLELRKGELISDSQPSTHHKAELSHPSTTVAAEEEKLATPEPEKPVTKNKRSFGLKLPKVSIPFGKSKSAPETETKESHTDIKVETLEDA